MSVRTKILALLDTLMRIPPLFIIDEILKNYNNNFVLFESSSNFITNNHDQNLNSTEELKDINIEVTNINLYILLVFIFKSLLCLIGE